MPTLKTKPVSYVEVDYKDLDCFIKEVYGLTYFSCAATEEWSNDSDHQMNVRKDPLSEYELKRLEEVKADKEPYYCLRIVMQDLVNRDLIPPANYLISVSW